MHKTYLFLLLNKRRKHHSLDSERVKTLARPLWIGVLSAALIVLSAAILAAGFLYSKVMTDLPSLDVLPVLLNPVDGELLQPTRILDRTGQTTLYTLENPGIERGYLAVNPEKKDHFNPQLIRAVVSNLDPTFWENPGYLLTDWQNPEPSTIAERLTSELLLWQEPPSTARAIRMKLLASQLVKRFGRTQVLEWYLNSAWFGHLAVGAESASQLYFEKSAADLDLAESAMLAVLIDAPALNPLDAPSAAFEMQRQFLAEMAQKQVIPLDEFSAALREEMALRPGINEPVSLSPAFTRHLIQALDSDFAQNRLQRGGLVIQSTLDLELQKDFICAAKTQLLRLQDGSVMGDADQEDECQTALLLPTQVFKPVEISGLAGAGIVLNPQNGQVLVYVEPTAVNDTLMPDAGYEPGSLLTPFVALAGFARGLSPASLEWDVPAEWSGSAAEYQNVDKTWHGAVNLRSAIANDYLVPMTDVLRQAGASNAWHLASVLGLSAMQNAENSESALFGGASASLLEIASAYGTLANSGIKSGVLDEQTAEINPDFVITIKSTTGRLLLDHQTPQVNALISEPLSYLINHVLSDESARWPTLGYPNALEIGQTAAAKMGTTLSKNQVWTVGYTPERLVLVWIGSTQNTEPAQELDPLMAAGLWHAMIRQSTQDLPNNGWSIPEGIAKVNVCVPSGMLPSVDCPTTMEEIFISGNQPTLVDTLYEKIKVNRETGQRATVFTNPSLIDEKLFINVPAQARPWAIAAGLSVAPSGYDAIPATQADPDVQISAPLVFSPVGGKINIRGTAAGGNFASYTVQVGEGINPANWLQIHEGTSAVASDGDLAVWDTEGLDGLYAIRLTVIDQDQKVHTATIQVTVDNTPPQVKITYPAADQEIRSIKGNITLQAEIEDTGGLKTVEWWLDGERVSTQTGAPFVYLMPATSGIHTLQLIAADSAGNQTTTNKLEFKILK